MSVNVMEDIQDIVNSWRKSIDRGNWRDAHRSYQYHACEDLIFNNHIRGEVSYGHRWTLKVGGSKNTQESSLFDEDTTNRSDITATASNIYSFFKTHYLLDIREPSFQGGNDNQIVNYIAMQEAGMYDDMYEKVEYRMWDKTPGPNDGTNGKVRIQGIPSIITQDNTAGRSAFDWRGEALSSYSDGKKFAVDVSSNRGLKNGTAQYTSASDGDLGRKLAEACRRSGFRPAKQHTGEVAYANIQSGCKLYSSYKPLWDYEEQLGGGNEDMGRDMAKYRSGSTLDEPGLYMKMDWCAVPALSEPYMTDGTANPARDTYEPIYGINLRDLKFATYGDWWMKDAEITPGDSHNTRAIWMDFGGQFIAHAFRTHFVLTATSQTTDA